MLRMISRRATTNSYYAAMAEELSGPIAQSIKRTKNSLLRFLGAGSTTAVLCEATHLMHAHMNKSALGKVAIYYGMFLTALSVLASFMIAEEAIHNVRTNISLRAKRASAKIKSRFYL